jgi:U3 small nucleolar RNA-associated protein 23
MRVGRAKLVRKYLRFYRIVFGLVPPFRIILDGNFLYAAFKYKLDIRERLARLLQGEEIKLYLLQSSLDEFEQVGKATAECSEFARSFCTIIDDSKFKGESLSDRLIDFISKESTIKEKNVLKRYFVATQDSDLKSLLAAVGGIPLIYLNKVIFVLEPPSKASREYNRDVENAKAELTGNEKDVVGQVDSSTGSSNITAAVAQPEKPKERKKRKATAANPLSCIKASDDSQRTKKRKSEKYRRH